MTKKTAIFLLLTFVAVCASVCAFAQDGAARRVVRVGCMNHHQFIDQTADGDFYGYAVEYLEEICKHTDWQIEYVVAPWETQLQMLEEGTLDMMPFAQYTKARAEKYAFSRQPMDTVQGLLCVRDDNTDIFYNEFSAFDGKTVGVMAGNENLAFLRKFADLHDFKLEIKKYPFHKDSVDALMRGEVDLLATEQVIGREGIRIVAHFGSDPSYFMLNKQDTALMDQLNEAMNEIYSRDGTFRSRLYQKYYGNTIMHAKPIFTREEIDYIQNRGVIDVMLLPDSQPGSYLDEKNNYVGIVPDFMNLVSELSGLQFNFHYGENGVPPLLHLKEHPDDVIAGVLSINRAFREAGVLMSNDFYSVYASLIANPKNTEHIDYVHNQYRLGIPPMFQAMILYIQDNYPNLTVDTSHTTILDNLDALDKGEIDLFCYDLNMILHYWGNPRFKNVRIVTTSFVEEPQCCVAMNTPQNKILMGIINKCIAAIPPETMQEIERYHVSQNYYRPTLGDTIYRLRLPLLLAVFLMLTVYLFLSYIITKSRDNARIIAKKNDELAVAVKRAESASNAKSDFLSRMSHDIRTPMNAIMGMTELARAEDVANPKVNEYLQKIDVSSRILLRLLNDILDSTALEKGKLKIVHVPFDLQKEIYTIQSLYETQCAYKKITFITDFTQIRHNALIGDALRVNQIILNLLSNAFKFTESGGKITYTVKETECVGNTITLVLTVSDTGCGMDDEMLARIWQPFEQKDAMTTHKYGGSGLGMNIAKNLTTLLHGKISVESKPNGGTTFTVELPFEIDLSREDTDAQSGTDTTAADDFNKVAADFAKAFDTDKHGARGKSGENANTNESTIGGVGASRLPESAPMGAASLGSASAKGGIPQTFDFTGKKILVADDDLFNRDVVTGLLERVHAQCTCVENGKEAVEAFMNAPVGSFDVILLDVHMPVLGGYDAAKQIRAGSHSEAATIPIFALTADTFPEDLEKAKQSGMNGHIGKPLYAVTLYEKLDAAINLYKDVRKKDTGGGRLSLW